MSKIISSVIYKLNRISCIISKKRKTLLYLLLFTMLFLSACSNNEKTEAEAISPTPVIEYPSDIFDSKKDEYIRESTYIEAKVIEENEDGEEGKNPLLNPESSLSVPTYITRIEDLYFIVDCYHDRVIYNENLTDPLDNWKVMTNDMHFGHTVVSDGRVYLIDDTENNRLLVVEKNPDYNGENRLFIETQEFKDIGVRPHYIQYDEKRDVFYAWSSMTGQMYLLRSDENHRVYITKILSIEELNGFYVRSFTIMEDGIYFVSGNANIIVADPDSLEIIKKYPVPDKLAGMVQVVKIEEDYYITISTDILGNQDAATIIRTKDLNNLINEDYEDIYSKFIGGGTPYCITEIDDEYYLCEHRIPGHSIFKFKVKEGEITEVSTIY